MTGADKYKYAIQHDGTNWVTVRLVKPLVISGGRDKYAYNFTRKSSAWKFVKYENAQLYADLLAYSAAPSDLSNDIVVRCQLYDDYATLTETVYMGYVPLSGLKINEDTGVIELTPTEKSDLIWYEQHKNDKVDVYNAVVGSTDGSLSYNITTVTEEYYLPDAEGYFVPKTFGEESASVASWSSTTAYVTGWTSGSWCRKNGVVYHCIQAHTDHDPRLPSSTAYWEFFLDGGGDPTNLVKRVYREVADLPFYNGSDYVQGDGVYETGFPNVTIENPYATNAPVYKWVYADNATQTGTMILCGTTTASNYVVSTGQNHSMLNILKHLWKIDYGSVQHEEPSGLILVSQFLTSATNPVTSAASTTNNLRLIHNRVLKGIQDLDTTGEMTLEAFMRDLCETFQLAWYIDGNVLYIEHIIYFRNGMSYTVPIATYTDLTLYANKWQVVNDMDGSESDNEYSFAVTDSCEKETFKFPDGYDYDGQIKYPSKFAIKGEVIEHNISTFMTDFAYVIAFRIDSSDDSWCLISAQPANAGTSVINRRNVNLRWVQCPYYVLGTTQTEYFRRVEANYPNGDMLWDNLLFDWWVYETVFDKGSINGRSTTSTFYPRAIYKQREIRFPRLQSGAFDPYKLIKTNMGDGVVDSFEIYTDTDFIKVELLYEES